MILTTLSACDSDDGTTPPVTPATGLILLQVQPDTLPATCTLTGPEGYELASTQADTIRDLAPGTYSCIWSDYSGWTKPDPFIQTATLTAGDTVTFIGTYQEIPAIWDTWVTIPAGSFLMGASEAAETSLRNEKPQHQVTISQPFLMQATEVTNAQYLDMAQWALSQNFVTANEDGLWDNMDGSTHLLMDFTDLVEGVFWCEIYFHAEALRLRDIGYGNNPDHPAKMMTWYGAAAYCDWQSMRMGLERAYDHSNWSCGGGSPSNAIGYRMPTEAEWEYACRAGTTTAFYSGDITNPWGTESGDTNEPALDGVAWYSDNSVDWTSAVAQLEPNAWGLYDMHGNLFKWVNGYEYTYGADAVVDPSGSDPSNYRIVRGGPWTRPSHYHRSAFRLRIDATELTYGSPKLGFRPVKTIR